MRRLGRGSVAALVRSQSRRVRSALSWTMPPRVPGTRRSGCATSTGLAGSAGRGSPETPVLGDGHFPAAVRGSVATSPGFPRPCESTAVQLGAIPTMRKDNLWRTGALLRVASSRRSARRITASPRSGQHGPVSLLGSSTGRFRRVAHSAISSGQGVAEATSLVAVPMVPDHLGCKLYAVFATITATAGLSGQAELGFGSDRTL